MMKQSLLKRITTSAAIADGRPVIRKQNLIVEEVLGRLAEGETYKTLLRRYSWLKPEDIQACLLSAQQLVEQAQPELS